MTEHCFSRALQAGDLLNKAKVSVPHGGWKDWLAKHCNLSERTAQRYMKLAENRQMIEAKMKTATVADLTLRQAERLIAGPGQSRPAPSGEPAKGFGGNDPMNVVKAQEDKFLSALKTLKRNDPEKAKGVASAIVRRLEDLELLPAA